MNALNQMNSAQLAWFKKRLPRSYEKAINAHTPTVIVENEVSRENKELFIEKPDLKSEYPLKIDMRIAAYERELRRIRGCLISMQGEYDRVDEAYQGVVSVKRRNNSKIIRRMLCEVSGLQWSQIIAQSRFKKVLQPRQAGMYLYRQHTDLSFSQIGKIFGRTDHSTVHHSCERVETRMWEFKKYIEPIEAELT